MKLKITQPVIKNGHPYIEIIEPLTEDDMRITRNIEHRKENRSITVTVGFTPEEDIRRTLEKYKIAYMGNGSSLYDLCFEYINKNDHIGIPAQTPHHYEEKYLTYDFRGIRSDSGREQKMRDALDDAESTTMSVLERRGIRGINNALNGHVHRINSNHIQETTTFFCHNHFHPDYWDEVFSESSDHCELKRDTDSLQRLMDDLNLKMRAKVRQKRELEKDMITRHMQGFVIPNEVRKSVMQELNKEEEYFDPDPFR